LEPRSLEDALKRASILVNATSAGMVPRAEESPVPVGLLHRRLTVFDTVYNPLETRLLRDARGAGCKVISGLEMLVHQGASAFTKWTGKNAPVGLMHRKALEVLKKR
ncbi:MAG: shikimate dehydrogenase, partial [Dehalococcoidales bacterium]|nr:shikimate dehydrogenase [Dehalococcoidales bacterium]